MRTPAPSTGPRGAIAASIAIFATAILLLQVADEATDIAAIAAGTGIIVAGSLLGMSLLVWRWRRGTGYMATELHQDDGDDRADSHPAAGEATAV